MEDPSRTNPEPIKEISSLKQKIKELEQSESERKRVSEALRKSEEYYKAIIQNSSDIILVLNKLGTITYASPSVERFLGYGPDELIGKRTLDLIVSDDKPRAIADFGRALLIKGVLIPNVFRIRHKDGTERILEGFGKNLLDNPVVAGFVMNVRDITERKQAEEALLESEERYRTLVENASDIIYKMDATGHITFANPAGLRVTGYEEELIGKHYPAFIRPDMRDDAIKFFGRQFVKGIQNTYSEYPILTKEGHEVWLGQNTQLIVKDGHVIGFQAVSRDITDRKRMEEALRESEERYRTILENIEDGYFEVDIAGNFTFFNDSVCRMVGYTRAEMMGMNNRQYTDKENSRILYQAFNKIFRTGESSKGVGYEIIGKDGTKRYIESSVALIRDTSGQPIGFRGIMRNITERKRMEEALRDSEKRYRELSIVDDLTQLYNSRHFYFQLKIELDRSNRYEQPLTLLLLDLDDFKAFNDAYGHVEGDQVLKRLGQVVKRCLRVTDLAYRYGGEEFTILLPMTTSADGAVTAERIRTEFKKESFSPAPGQDAHVTVSIGIAQYKQQEEMKAFVHRVDRLMYQGKKNGKDRVCSKS